jgi:hypothetical protein
MSRIYNLKIPLYRVYFLANKNSDFPSSPRSNSARSSTQNTHPPPQHLVNVVGAAMSASRKQKGE